MNTRFVRRDLLRAALLSPAAMAAPARKAAREVEAKNIIFMVSDGMSPGVHVLSEEFSRQVRGRSTQWSELLVAKDAIRGQFDMASLNSMVTDSAAASTSWGSGSRVINGAINVLPDGTRMTPIARLARDRGRKVGLVSTATITHATPAGFAAVQPDRDDEALIALQYVDVVDVCLGGGNRFFSPELRKDKKDVYELYRQQGYDVLRNRDELRALKGQKKLLGIFDDSHLTYRIDVNQSDDLKARIPTLKEMTEAALTALADSPKGFLLQVEGARIDHAAHVSDAATLLWEQLEFDDALRLVVEFARKRNDTLVVVGSDHGNSSPSLIGMGTEYADTNDCFLRMALAKGSFDLANKRMGIKGGYNGMKDTKPEGRPAPDAATVRETFFELFGLELDEEEAGLIRLAVENKSLISANRQLNTPSGVMGQVLGNYNGIQFTGSSHTADYVITTAIGPGREEFAGLVRNTDVFRKLTKLMGVRFENPSMAMPKKLKREAARVYVERPHWV
jgi:alkaline phosphatase